MINEYLVYDPTSISCLRWIKKPYRSSVKVGSDAWTHISNNGYYGGMYSQKRYSAHQVIMYLEYGIWSNYKLVIDHINGDKLDNRLDNLRFITSGGNASTFNVGASKNSKTGVRGVAPIGDKYQAYYRGKNFGKFTTVEEAKKVVQEAMLNDKEIL